jgi:membrane protein
MAAKIDSFIRGLWAADLRSVGAVPRVAIQTARLIIAVALEFRHRLLDARAAGLVYTTLLSLVPFLAVLFSVLKAFGAHHQIEPMLGQLLEPLGPKGQEITQQVIQFADNLKVGVLGGLGIAGLMYTTYSLIDKVEQALNAIWQVRQGRTWTRKFTDYLSVVMVGPVLVVTALGLLASVQNQTLVQRVMGFQPLGAWLVWLAQFGPFLLLAGVFTFLYKFIPNTRVNTVSALVGGICAALLWGVAGVAFAKFVAGSGQYSVIYAGFAILILFLIWLYTVWLIVLIGAQVAFFHQHPSAYQTTRLWHRQTLALREQVALMVAAALTRRFLRGDGPVSPAALAGELNLSAPLVDEQVELLVTHGFLGRMNEPEGVILIKSPDATSLGEVLDAVREVKASSAVVPIGANDPVAGVLRRRDEAVAKALAGLTLRSLADESAVTVETGPDPRKRS